MYIAYTAKKWFQKRKKQEKQGNKNNGKNVRESVLNATSVELKKLSRRSIIATDQELQQWFDAIDFNHEGMFI